MMAKAFIGISLLGIGLVGACIAVAASADASEGSYVVPGSKAADLSNCVRETDFMRRNHMELILHQRDVTVHEGIRATKYSLSGCVDCHVSYNERQQPVSIYADGQFCHACHEFAAVDLTCFGCHAAVPVFPDAVRGDQVPPQVDRKAAPAAAGVEGAGILRPVNQGVGE